MAFTLKLLNLQKRVNSTKQPTAAQLNAATSYSVTLLDDTSLLHPTFKLSGGNPIGNNYAYVAEWGRYYFIDDISSHQNFWYISCRCDLLATFKTPILSGSHYVLRSASQRDEYILDTAYISKVKESGTFVPITDPFAYTNGHSYVWCIAGDVIGSQTNNEQIGSNVYYWMNDNESQTFVNYLMDVQHYGIQTAEYSEAVQKALVNPMQYINSVILLPFEKNAALSTNNHVKFGYYDIEVAGGNIKRLTQGTMIHTDTLTVNIPKHPQAASRGKYMNNAPYTAYELYFGPFGTIPLDPASLIDNNTLTITIRTECATGVSQIFVRGSSTDVMIYAGTAQVGVPVTVSQLTRDMLGEIQNNLNMQYTAAGGALQIAGAAINPASAVGAAGGVLGTVMNYGAMAFDAVRLQYPTLSGGGANGSFMSMHSTSYLNAKFYECVGTNNTELGRPLYQTKTLSTLSGFTVCQGADVEIGAMAAESDQINSMLNSGFYIE